MILELCLAAERRLGVWMSMICWDKTELDLGKVDTGMIMEEEEEGER